MVCAEKQAIRQECQRRREAIAQKTRATRSGAICERIISLDVYQTVRSLHCYVPIRSEVNTLPLLADALARGKGVVVPVVRRGSEELAHTWLTSLAAEDWQPGLFGIPQPRTFCPAEAAECQLLVVPLLAFDRSGYRLGYGKGYYDRLLAACHPPLITVGAAFAAQEIAAVPREPHDLPLNWIVTETEIIKTTEMTEVF
ncbi:MAG: 5-formyltetrahydrofolate cyclo-ligase [Chloroflexaceae bacterium]|nr:5-formyltetrahydrofolate cyclo-ligase [Chloroflexaceae bacterium]